ncbi:MAG TPA: SRPBCC domain-containing protein, partial [Solirubrobacterales bacterium]|nr:SRPBCC domain-containing protein [Solirubrobacterales bacterium]
PPGGREMTFRPTVLKVETGRELRWRGRLLVPGIFDGEHCFRLTPAGPGTRLEQGESFTGLLPRFMSVTLGQTERGFNELNQALKERAEARDPVADR